MNHYLGQRRHIQAPASSENITQPHNRKDGKNNLYYCQNSVLLNAEEGPLRQAWKAARCASGTRGIEGTDNRAHGTTRLRGFQEVGGSCLPLNSAKMSLSNYQQRENRP